MNIEWMNDLRSSVRDNVADRSILLLNHLLMSEPVAQERLRQRAGRLLRMEWEGQPSWAPALDPLNLAITPAGLLERIDQPTLPADLVLQINAARVAKHMASKGRPGDGVQLHGDSELAADVAWLLENLRWDAEADLARFLPAPLAHQISQGGEKLIQTLGKVRSTLSGVMSR